MGVEGSANHSYVFILGRYHYLCHLSLPDGCAQKPPRDAHLSRPSRRCRLGGRRAGRDCHFKDLCVVWP